MRSFIAYVFFYNFLNYEIKNYKVGHSFNTGAKKCRGIYDWIIHGKNRTGRHKSQKMEKSLKCHTPACLKPIKHVTVMKILGFLVLMLTPCIDIISHNISQLMHSLYKSYGR